MNFLETVSMLEANGWTVECESPFEIRHDETGSFATNIAAHAVAADLRASLADELDADVLPPLKQAEAFAELVQLTERAERYVATAAAVGPESAENTETNEAWETAYHLVFSREINHRAGELQTTLNQKLDWSDPDAGYEDDVRAYVGALSALVKRVTPFFADQVPV